MDEIKMPEGTHLAYSVAQEEWWVSRLCRHDKPDDGRPTLHVYAQTNEDGGCQWEFVITEYDLDRPSLRVQMFYDSWPAFTALAPFFATLATTPSWTLAEVRELLDSLGAVDDTVREQPAPRDEVEAGRGR